MLSLTFDQSMTFEKKNNDIGKKKKQIQQVYRDIWSSLDSTKHSKA